ncbi:zinc finger protein 3-like isoform X1 [Sphaeramia orbicularis]|uniref:zinc finger protein 3-like isoform X1 n=1 Tax=Sphaeramia orbicularis TaxID=375764 RepID=UPI00117DA742|nr:zinc finger protein 3-like isoform X1 [Sphaeramia orbicularis]
MSTAMDFHSQIASIMEVLANAAVAEICKVVDDGYAVVHLEMSRSQKENEFLRRKIKLLELQIARYRAERVKGAEGSISSRFPGVRLLNRQSREAQAGPSFQGRTRFLNRSPAAQQSVQKSQSINLDQDPDQEVVTTTKSESTEPEDEHELMIVKVEGAVDTSNTSHEAPVEAGISTRGDANTTSKDTSDSQPAGRRSEIEGQGFLKSRSSSWDEEKKVDEVQDNMKAAVPPEKHGPCQTLQKWQEGGNTEDVDGLTCSSHRSENIQGKSAFSQKRPTATSGFVTIPSTSPGASDIIVVESHPHKTPDSYAPALPSIKEDGDAGEDMNIRSQYESLQCIEMNEPSSDVIFEDNGTQSNHVSNISNPSIFLGSEESQQQTLHAWSGIQQIDNPGFSDQNHLYQLSTSQNQESGLMQQQQPSLPYACTFCSRRYAHHCQLRIHERVHTGEKPYQCVQCGKSFGQFCSLKRHQMVHTGERPFPCPHCGKQFSTSTNLKVHQSVHTGEKRFHCSKCGKNFSFLSNLIRHQALHTNK